jgi:hypothetical protein
MSHSSASRQDEAAPVIQKHVRRYQAQKRYKQQKSAASTMQQHTARFFARRKVRYAVDWPHMLSDGLEPTQCDRQFLLAQPASAVRGVARVHG